jgi:hypothetical protein
MPVVFRFQTAPLFKLDSKSDIELDEIYKKYIESTVQVLHQRLGATEKVKPRVL